MTVSAVKTTTRIVGFTRSYPEHMTIRDSDGSFKRLSCAPDDDNLTADLEIDVESEGKTTTYSADIYLSCAQEIELARCLKWAVEEHRKKLLSGTEEVVERAGQ